jgi:hypothetical protein
MTEGAAEKLLTVGECPTLTVTVAVVGKAGDPGVQAMFLVAVIV